MPATQASQITTLLRAWADGDRAASDRLIPKLYAELHRMARRYMRRERKGHTLQTSALVNEAFLRLVGAEGAGWQVPDTSSTRDREFIAIDGALEEPAKMDPRKVRVIEFAFFRGIERRGDGGGAQEYPRRV
jgi:hypothetical protein